jgi:adenine-specific DNA-methyltransferase
LAINKRPTGKSVETLLHEEAKRRNIPTAEFQSVVQKEAEDPVRVAYERRNRDLDPQLVWRGKDEQDWSDLVVQAPPLYIQEKVHPKVLIDDLLRQTKERQPDRDGQLDLFADFNGIPEGAERTEFYQHDQNWSNRMILGDSLQVMASLAEREGLRGKVQCIYLDPPYGIKFNSNFQWSTTSRDVKDGNAAHITREPEQVKAFRDTWRDGIHSYLTYLRDRLTVARDLLTDSGSIFVQIGDENVHRIRALLDEVFSPENFVSLITFKKSSSATERYLSSTSDYLLWFAKSLDYLKYRPVKNLRALDAEGADAYRLHEFLPGHWRALSSSELREAAKDPNRYRILRLQILTSQRQGRDTGPSGAMSFPVEFQGSTFLPSRGRGWTTTRSGIDRLIRAERIGRSGGSIN